MNPSEIILGCLLAVVLLGLAGYYAWRQKNTLRNLRSDEWSPEDRVFLRKQVTRRLWCSALMVVFALMLVGWFFLQAAEPPRQENQQEATPEQREYAWQIALYWTAAFVVLFSMIVLAAMDMVAIGRFARRKQRQLDADRQAILESHVAQYRKNRNGEG
jgi:uncharacterized protein HemX